MMAMAAALAVVVATGAGCGSDGGATTTGAATAAGTDGCHGSIGVVAPYGDVPGPTADDGSIMNWARLGIDGFNQEHGTSFHIVPEDVDFSAADARGAARRLAANREVIGVVGAKTSAATQAMAPILDAAGLAYVSPTATATALADGHLKGFHRVVPDDALQATTMAGFITGTLKGTKVVVVHNPDPYSRGLAAGLTASLKHSGVTPVAQVRVPLNATAMAPYVAQIPADADVVALTMLSPVQASKIIRQVRAKGRNPAFVGGDIMFTPSGFREAGAYVLSYAPDVRATDRGMEVVRLYQSVFGAFSPYGSPAYAATQVVADAALRTCHDGGTTRQAVAGALATTDMADPVSGGQVRFLPNGNLKGGRFHVYRVTGDGYAPAG